MSFNSRLAIDSLNRVEDNKTIDLLKLYTYKQVSRYKVENLLKSSKGKIFSCLFIKKNGMPRKMVARFGAKINLKGGRNGEGLQNNHITVYDMINRGYRKIDLSTISEICINKERYLVI